MTRSLPLQPAPAQTPALWNRWLAELRDRARGGRHGCSRLLRCSGTCQSTENRTSCRGPTLGGLREPEERMGVRSLGRRQPGLRVRWGWTAFPKLGVSGLQRPFLVSSGDDAAQTALWALVLARVELAITEAILPVCLMPWPPVEETSNLAKTSIPSIPPPPPPRTHTPTSTSRLLMPLPCAPRGSP